MTNTNFPFPFTSIIVFLYHCQDFYRTWLWVLLRVSYKKQEHISEDRIRTKLYEKRDDFKFPIVNFIFSKSSFLKFYRRHHDMANRYGISVS